MSSCTSAKLVIANDDHRLPHRLPYRCCDDPGPSCPGRSRDKHSKAMGLIPASWIIARSFQTARKTEYFRDLEIFGGKEKNMTGCLMDSGWSAKYRQLEACKFRAKQQTRLGYVGTGLCVLDGTARPHACPSLNKWPGLERVWIARGGPG